MTTHCTSKYIRLIPSRSRAPTTVLLSESYPFAVLGMITLISKSLIQKRSCAIPLVIVPQQTSSNPIVQWVRQVLTTIYFLLSILWILGGIFTILRCSNKEQDWISDFPSDSTIINRLTER